MTLGVKPSLIEASDWSKLIMECSDWSLTLSFQEPVKPAPPPAAAGHHDAVDGRADPQHKPPAEPRPHTRLSSAAPVMTSALPPQPQNGPKSLPAEVEVRGHTEAEAETEERRRTAQRVFSKQR